MSNLPNHDSRRVSTQEDFSDALGVLVESVRWMPRMCGRVMGRLLIAETPLTQAEIREELGASLGSVSTATRTLLDKRLITKVSLPGTREMGFQLHPKAWRNLEEDGVKDVRDYLELATDGLNSLGPGNTMARKNLSDMREYFAAVESRMLEVLRWLDGATASTSQQDEQDSTTSASQYRHH